MANFDLFIVSAFVDLDLESNSRINNIYNFSCGNKLVITSNFDHGSKSFKKLNSVKRSEIQLKVPSYRKNIGLKRIISHIVFAYKLYKFLNSLKQHPRGIYCSMPTSTSAFICGLFCRRNRIKFFIDVIDLWPDSLIPVGVFKYFKYFLYPWKWTTLKAYKYADYIIAESEQYAKIASKYNPHVPVKICYLGIDIEKISKLIESSRLNIRKPKNELWICYAGSLGNSYDFDELITAIYKFQKSKTILTKLIFIGDGVKKDYVKTRIQDLNLNAEITGRLCYGDFLKYLSFCDIGVNIFKRDTMVAHSYKFNDYIATKLFILNNLQGESAILVDKYQIGLNFDYLNSTLYDRLLEIINNWEYYKYWRNNCDYVINNVLNTQLIYSNLGKDINNHLNIK